MAKEYHEEFVHVIADCKTGNKAIDEGVECSIIGYVNLVMYALKTEKMNLLTSKMFAITQEIYKENNEDIIVGGDNKNKCEHDNVLKIYKDDTHQDISHYRCAQCGDKKEFPFGKNVLK